MRASHYNAIALAIASTLTAASSNAAAAETLTNMTITSVKTYDTYAWITYTGPATTLCAGSATYPNVVIIDWSTVANRKAVYTSLVAAYLVGKTVTMSASSCFDFGPGTAQLPAEYSVTM